MTPDQKVALVTSHGIEKGVLAVCTCTGTEGSKWRCVLHGPADAYRLEARVGVWRARFK